MIYITIKTDEEPEVSALTNTGLQPYKPTKELITCDDRYTPFIPTKIELEFDENWSLFGSEIYRVINWWSCTYFSARKTLNIEVKIE